MIEIITTTAEKIYPIRHTVMYPDLPFDYIKLPKDNQGTHFAVVKNEKIVSIVSVFIENNVAQFRKLATLESEQKQGYGTYLLKHIIKYAKNKGCEKLWCNARLNKAGYYKKFGMYETNKTYTKSGIDFIVLEMDLS
ncbi:GNAT family N-acetyltransferase [Cellulophaga baltica]|uniref:GNAT family N-acetyltransferase n=1 Tax=Cellulophaga TaxID=104264 RepID=UPI001C06F91F|nr:MULTISPECIES: GNAT family N-acetyltransferase [Cellulophaga]MBU2997317.1 GNAT family N-acetyltransferase [Cellulophaga baltica]MDO6768715.1 GNAT family N-acetyltransferase [Cellulophaga sp. 1_MG-2023]